MTQMLSDALQEFTGLLKQLMTNLLGNEAEVWGNEFRKFCRKEPCWQPVQQVVKKVIKRLTPWKDLPVGSTTAEELAASVGKNCEEVSPEAKFLMAQMTVAPSLGTVNLVILTPRDIGLTSNSRTNAFMTKEFCAKWSAENLDGCVIELCEAEDGPRLREQYQDQPNGEVLWMAMERSADSGGYPSVFLVVRNGGGARRLHASWANPRGGWVLVDRIVFRLRRLPVPSVS